MALTDGLELAINFNSDVLDKSGNGRDGTVYGMTYDTSNPIIGSGTGEFDGVNDRVSIDVAASPQSDILDLTVGTIALWVRLPNLFELKRLFTVCQGLAFPNSDEWAIDWRGDDARHILQVTCINGGAAILATLSESDVIADNNKHLIIVKADGSGDIEMIVDDNNQTLQGGGPRSDKFFGHAVDANNINIGAIERDTINYSGDKDIDALAIWNRALTTAEMTEYYNSGAGVELDLIGAASGRRRRMMQMAQQRRL